MPVWRYRERPLVELINLPASVAEEYYGLRFARQALDIDPRYEPVVLYLDLEVWGALAAHSPAEQHPEGGS